MNLITAAACLKKLKSDAEIDYSKSYFSQLAADDKVRSHHKPGSPKKWYVYEEVLEDIESMQDPRRDPQRAANDAKRKHDDLFSCEVKYETEADLTPEQIESRRQKLIVQYKANKEEEDASGVENPGNYEDIEAMSTKQIAFEIMKQDLRIKTATANEKEKLSMPVDEIQRSVFVAMRILRDGLTGIPARLSSRLAVESDPHKCRTMMEEEINRHLTSIAGAFNDI